MSGLRPSLRPRDIPSHRRTAASRPVVREGRALQSFPGLGHRPPRTICFWSVAARGRGAESSLLVPLHPRCPERPWRLVRLKRPFAPFLSLWRPFRRHSYTTDVNRKGSGRGPRGRSGLGNTRSGRRPGKQKTAFGSRGSRCFLPESGGPARSWPSFVVRFGVATSRTLVAGKQE